MSFPPSFIQCGRSLVSDRPEEFSLEIPLEFAADHDTKVQGELPVTQPEQRLLIENFMFAATDKMQTQRFELKYLIPEDTALKVRNFVRSYLEVDEFGANQPDHSYSVHSVYLDSDDLKLYWNTINGDKNRFKLRVRFYDDQPDVPVFLEIKRRMNDCILKQRCAVDRNALHLVMRGYLVDPEHLLSRIPKHHFALQNFQRLMQEVFARPKVHIAYKREAYLSGDGGVRVTMDREVLGEPHFDASISTRMHRPVLSYRGLVILELKFTNRFPNWFGELVRASDVMQCGAAKYVSSINSIGSRRLNAPSPVAEEESLLSTCGPGEPLSH